MTTLRRWRPPDALSGSLLWLRDPERHEYGTSGVTGTTWQADLRVGPLRTQIALYIDGKLDTVSTNWNRSGRAKYEALLAVLREIFPPPAEDLARREVVEAARDDAALTLESLELGGVSDTGRLEKYASRQECWHAPASKIPYQVDLRRGAFADEIRLYANGELFRAIAVEHAQADGIVDELVAKLKRASGLIDKATPSSVARPSSN